LGIEDWDGRGNHREKKKTEKVRGQTTRGEKRDGRISCRGGGYNEGQYNGKRTRELTLVFETPTKSGTPGGASGNFGRKKKAGSGPSEEKKRGEAPASEAEDCHKVGKGRKRVGSENHSHPS